ncbi:MAG: hypothetical protein WCG83_03450 [Candidatus Peregrinibacteria bacterium]
MSAVSLSSSIGTPHTRERSPDVLMTFLHEVRELHRAEYAEAGEYTQFRSFQLLQEKSRVEIEAHRADFRQRIITTFKLNEGNLQEQIDSLVEASIAHATRLAVMEMCHDPTLSRPVSKKKFERSDVSTQRLGMLTLLQEFEDIVTGEECPKAFERFAWVYVDVNGLKSFINASSTHHANEYLQELAYFLEHRSAQTRAFLEEQGVIMDTYSAVGDEFGILLRGTQPLSEEFFQDFTRVLEKEIEADERLQSFLSFDHEATLQNIYQKHRTKEEWRQFEQDDPDTKARKLLELKATLPPHFIPSVAMGITRLDEAMKLVAIDPKRGKTFGALCSNILDLLRDMTEARMHINKDADKARMINSGRTALVTWWAKSRLSDELVEQMADLMKQIAEIQQMIDQTGFSQNDKGRDEGSLTYENLVALVQDVRSKLAGIGANRQTTEDEAASAMSAAV